MAELQRRPRTGVDAAEADVCTVGNRTRNTGRQRPPGNCSASGAVATISQLSLIALPLLMPPWKKIPLAQPRVDGDVEPVPMLVLSAELGRGLDDVPVQDGGPLVVQPGERRAGIGSRESLGTVTLNGRKSPAESASLSSTMKLPMMRR